MDFVGVAGFSHASEFRHSPVYDDRLRHWPWDDRTQVPVPKISSPNLTVKDADIKTMVEFVLTLK